MAETDRAYWNRRFASIGKGKPIGGRQVALILNEGFEGSEGSLWTPMPASHSDLQFIYVTTTGRITGKPREIEIWFVEDGENLYVLAEHFFETQWVKNIQRNPDIRVRMGVREFAAKARILDRGLDASTWQMAQRLAREKYGWGEGLPVELVRRSADYTDLAEETEEKTE